MAALGDGIVVLVNQDSLDTGAAEFDTQDGFPGIDGLFCVHTT